MLYFWKNFREIVINSPVADSMVAMFNRSMLDKVYQKQFVPRHTKQTEIFLNAYLQLSSLISVRYLENIMSDIHLEEANGFSKSAQKMFADVIFLICLRFCCFVLL